MTEKGTGLMLTVEICPSQVFINGLKLFKSKEFENGSRTTERNQDRSL
jgi:hypothetical protein